ncbi:MAG: hypothetical protein JXR97_11715 [Planctomycetes bacterium]|nr:hypothetical protein [Planctomycetota bacterium]
MSICKASLNGRCRAEEPQAVPAMNSTVAEGLPAESPDAESPTRANLKDVVECLTGWLRQGKSDLEALVLLKDEFCIRGAFARKALDRAHENINASHTQRTAADRLALAVEQRETIICKAMENSDYRVALSAMDSRDKLLQLGDTAVNSALPQSLLDLIELAARGRIDGPNEQEM